MADRNVQMPEGYRPDDLLGNVVDCLCDRLHDAGLISDYDDRQASLAETCRLVADALGDGDYYSAGDAIWSRVGPMLDWIAFEVAQHAGAPAVDPHEFDHSWTDDGSGHCKVCGAPSADQDAADRSRPRQADPQAQSGRSSSNAQPASRSTIRSFIAYATRHDAVDDEVTELVHEHVVEGRYHPSVVAESLRRVVNDALAAATADDWRGVADELITEAREVTGTDTRGGCDR